jgi:ElaB/YqjD/DUF883 family membrane-anchored ribosome-binding protein
MTDSKQGTNDSGSRRAETSEHLATLAHETVDRLAGPARDAEQRLRARASVLREQAHEQEERALRALDAKLEKTRSLIAGKPLIAACVAFATGVLLTGLMVRR